MGMKIGAPLLQFTHLQLRGNDTRELLQYFKEQKKNELQLVIVIIPDMKGPYSEQYTYCIGIYLL